jgi:hypothetical protein
MDKTEVDALAATEKKISQEITKRRRVLNALTFMTQTNFLVSM